MNEDPEENPGNVEEGAPDWMVTYGDMMTLLLCFFVLLLSFSEMDVLKYKQLSGSLREAFGVQKEKPVFFQKEGHNVMQSAFAEDAAIIEVLEKLVKIVESEDGEKQDVEEKSDEKSENKEDSAKDNKVKENEKVNAEGENEKEVIENKLGDFEKGEIGLVELEEGIRLRISGQILFDLGETAIKPAAFSLLNKLSKLLREYPFDIVVEGHSDNLPINTPRFHSNWDLSAIRASTVVNYLIEIGHLDPGRFTATGFAETKPLFPNDNLNNRAKNRRVEFLFVRGSLAKKFPVLKPEIISDLPLDNLESTIF